MKKKRIILKLLCVSLCLIILPFSLSACNINDGTQEQLLIKQEDEQDENEGSIEQTGEEQGVS